MKVIITGISGFVGQNLSSYLSEKLFSVDAVSLRNSTWKGVLDGDAIIHLAGKAHDTKKTSDASEYFNINTDLTKDLFDAFLQSDIQDFIYFSSVKAVADEVSSILNEDVVGSPKTPYGKSKLQAEEYILSKNLPEGKRVFIIRPCMIHGPGNKGNLNLLYQLVAKGLPWPLGAFENQRSFSSIENLCFVIKELLQNKSISSGIYNVADDEFLSTNELIELLGESLGKRNKILKIPTSLIKKIASVGDVLKLPLNSERLQKLTESYMVSNQKIVAAIGKPLPIDAKAGLLKTFESFKQK
ncbi:Nucleoside-diphosphate-sugar epimerase [Flavobacterium flevense]|uniref:Nucleoside-diphosphate-sugar epimerase n=1 Tax=Flavobacterium flevense TaxID=983 RepID=A0A4Y4B1D3_9FLAO|nr:NAD-dependent epimerase/dehydratase family protein [Flavobacterium flevense]GEC73202.1 nucleoside-diphosphate-sugar epimerase [Flavobacterium flevense]SHL99538.1 Nucleoside-diphosphate-sugar epimerase [Flavobacterium flevense]